MQGAITFEDADLYRWVGRGDAGAEDQSQHNSHQGGRTHYTGVQRFRSRQMRVFICFSSVLLAYLRMQIQGTENNTG
jgi:hypothetical protein